MKQMLCRFFANGWCSNGAQCAYAHGEGELGFPLDVPGDIPTFSSVKIQKYGDTLDTNSRESGGTNGSYAKSQTQPAHRRQDPQVELHEMQTGERDDQPEGGGKLKLKVCS